MRSIAGGGGEALVQSLLWSCLSFAVACGGGQDAGEPAPAARAPRTGGTLVLGSTADVQSWNEYLARSSFSVSVLRRIYLPLAYAMPPDSDGDPEFRPGLAESWETTDRGTKLVFHLRDAAWSDGRPITADDVRFTWQAQTSPDVAWANAAPAKDRIVDVEALDARTAVFHFDRAYPYALADAVEGGILPRHVFGEVPFSDWRTHDWSAAGIASGPFLLERHRPGEEVVLARNPGYFDPNLPRVDRVVIRMVPDDANLLTQLFAGSIDFMDNVPTADAERVASRPGFTLEPYDRLTYDHIGWNERRSPFDDPQVRRALTLAIDRQALVDELLYGYGRVSVGPITASAWGADPSLAPWPYDPDEAERLLRGRGFTRGAGGLLERDGKPLSITMLTNAGNARREAATVKIQAQLARIGVRVEPRPLAFGRLIELAESGDYDAYLAGFTHTERDLSTLFGSGAVPPDGQNFVGYRSATLDSLLVRLEQAADRQQARSTLAEIQQEIHQGQPYTFLYETRRLAGAGDRLQGATVVRPNDPLALLETAWVTR